MTPAPDLWLAPRASAPVEAVVSLPGSESHSRTAPWCWPRSPTAPRSYAVRWPRATVLLMAAALSGLGTKVDTSGPSTGWSSRGRAGPRRVRRLGLAGTVMRFVPRSGLSTGPVEFDGDPHMRKRPMGPVLTPCARSASVDEGDATRCRSLSRHGPVPGGKVVIDASVSSQMVSGLLLAGARFEKGVAIRHGGRPVPSMPHIAMTVAMLRQPGVEVDDSGGRWRVAPGPIRAVDLTVEPTCPTPLRSSPGRGVRAGAHRRDGPTPRPRPVTSCARSSRRWAPPWSRPRGTAVPGRARPGSRVDLHDVGELTPSPHSARSPRGRPGSAASPTSAATRPTASRRWPPRSAAWEGSHRESRRPVAPARAAVRRGVPDVRRPPDGARRPRSSGRGRGVEVEDVATTAKTLPDFPRRRAGMLGSRDRRERRYNEQDQEDDDRPRRRTRPRTKERPSSHEAVEGVVVAVDRGRYTCWSAGAWWWR